MMAMTPHERELRRLLDKLVLDAVSSTLLAIDGILPNHTNDTGGIHARLAAQKDAIIRMALAMGE